MCVEVLIATSSQTATVGSWKEKRRRALAQEDQTELFLQGGRERCVLTCTVKIRST
jgi:hypothetical protein